MTKYKKNLKKENEDLKRKLYYNNFELDLLKQLLKTNSIMILALHDCYLFKKKTGKSLKI